MFEVGSVPPSPSSLYLCDDEREESQDEEEESEEEYGDENEYEDGFIEEKNEGKGKQQENQFSILAMIVEALRKSIVTCSVEREDICSLDISWPTEVRHVSHVTFDRFNGFLGLPVEFEPQLPRKVPSASVCVFGVSAESMQCSYDHRGSCVPTILLLIQKRLYSEGGLQAEGIFRINAENGQEDYVRDQLNRGLVPYGVDVHCLAGLIKAWFRELPKGILDSLTPEQVLHCNTEEESTELVNLLPQMEASLLGWAINLMADVVQHEHQNKMNARNIAMVFAPNMTQMADPLTALLHAVQVMNFLKSLILKTLREREESASKDSLFSSCTDSPDDKGDAHSPDINAKATEELYEPQIDVFSADRPDLQNLLKNSPTSRLENDTEDKFHSFGKCETTNEPISAPGDTTPVSCAMQATNSDKENKDQYSNGEVESFSDRLNWRKGVRKLCKHPVFQLSKPVKRGDGEACA